jgi:hypothetical protein
MYTKLKLHLERHMYKRGKNKGDAPANVRRRGMSHYRVVKGNDDTMRVHMWGTDIITAYPDGNVLIDTNGYHTHNTTILRLNEAFSFMPDLMYVNLRKQSVYSYSQPVLRVNDKLYSYYDRIMLNDQGEIVTPLQAFEQKRTDKVATKALADDVKASGFKDAFAILYATTTAEDIEQGNYSLFGLDWQDVLSNNEQADKWKLIIARVKYERDYWSARTTGTPWTEKSDAKACWATIMQYCKKNMYVVSRSSTFVL